MDKSNELFTKLKKRIGSTKLQQMLQELDDANKDKETETAVSFIEEISPRSSTSKEHGNSNSSSNNNNNSRELYDYYQLFLYQTESPLPPPPPSPSPPPPPVPVRHYHHQPLPPLQPRKDFHTTTSLLNSPLNTISAMSTTSIAATSPRVSSPIDLTFIAPTLSPLPPSPPPLPPPPPSPTPAPAVYKTTTTTTVSSSPRKNSHPKKISPPKPKKFGNKICTLFM